MLMYEVNVTFIGNVWLELILAVISFERFEEVSFVCVCGVYEWKFRAECDK